MSYIAVIDYGAGNLRSVVKAFERVGAAARIVEASGIDGANAIVLPGVGAFASLRRLGRKGKSRIRAAVESGIPFLGICLGMQALFEGSEESPGVPGLRILKGNVRRLRGDLLLPQIGWNTVKVRKECALFEDIPDGSYLYFAHSYAAFPKKRSVVAAVAEYGQEFAAAVASGSVFGVQFHPEKSGSTGLEILKNFVKFVRR